MEGPTALVGDTLKKRAFRIFFDRAPNMAGALLQRVRVRGHEHATMLHF